jgi:hypothetical protein
MEPSFIWYPPSDGLAAVRRPSLGDSDCLIFEVRRFSSGTPDETFDYKPMNDEPIRTLAAPLASLKIDSRLRDWPIAAAALLRHGISRVATARSRNSNQKAPNINRDSMVWRSVNILARRPVWT